MTSCFNEAMCTGVPDIFIWAIKQLTPTWLCRFIMYGLFANQKSTVISSHSRMASRMNPGSFMGTRACLGFLNLLCITVHLSTLNFVHHMSGHLQSNSKSLWNLSAAVLGLSISLSPSTLHGSYLHRRKQRRLQFLSPPRPILILGPAGRGPSVSCCLLFCEPLPSLVF